MTIAAIRLVFITFLTVAYGMIQIFCACSSIANASPIAAMSTHNTMAMNTSHHDMQDTAEHSQTLHNHSKKDGEVPSCEHCESQSYMTAAPDLLNISLSSTSAHVKAPAIIPTTTPWAHMQIASNTLVGLRWLAPPRITPVTLKIRLLA